MERPDPWIVTVTDVDIFAARRALASALHDGAPESRVTELAMDWHRLLKAQDQQRDQRHSFD